MPWSPMRSLLSPLPALAMLACGCEVPAEKLEGEVLLGGGGSEFVPLFDGDRVPLIFGPQGGYHLWGSVLARGLARGKVRLLFRVVRTDVRALIANIATTGRLIDVAPEVLPADAGFLDRSDGGMNPGAAIGDWGVSTGSFVFIDDPAAIDGSSIRLEVDVTDEAGATGHDERRLVSYRR